MPSYTVHVPEDGEDVGDRAARTAFVRDGFSVGAFLFGPLYLMRHRAWVAAAVWVALVLGGGWLCHLVHLPVRADVGLGLLVALFTGLEASSLRRLALDHGRFVLADVVEGSDREAGERAFFRAATSRGLPPRSTVPGGRPPPAGSDQVIGFFPDPASRR